MGMIMVGQLFGEVSLVVLIVSHCFRIRFIVDWNSFIIDFLGVKSP